MNVSQSEILAYALGDASAEVSARVRLAIQSDPECARAHEESLRALAASAVESDRLNSGFGAAMAASMKSLQAAPVSTGRVVRRSPVRVLSAWGGFAAAACAVFAWALYTPAGSTIRDFDIPSTVSSSETSFVSFSDSASADRSASYATLASGVSAVESGGTVSIAAGESAETLRIEKPVRLIASSGPVLIGTRN